jgi:hypothetical protein
MPGQNLAHTHARAHARTLARMHVYERTHARMGTPMHVCTHACSDLISLSRRVSYCGESRRSAARRIVSSRIVPWRIVSRLLAAYRTVL